VAPNEIELQNGCQGPGGFNLEQILLVLVQIVAARWKFQSEKLTDNKHFENKIIKYFLFFDKEIFTNDIFCIINTFLQAMVKN
jgi:hypothetical protein